MKESLRLQLNYDINANLKLLKTMVENKVNVPLDCVHLMGHNIAAHETWNSRIEMRSPKLGVWEGTPLDEMESSFYLNLENSIFILDKYPVEHVVNYTNTKGEPFSNSMADIFTHVLMHSMYHRGQIARSLREANIAPPDTNYISYRR